MNKHIIRDVARVLSGRIPGQTVIQFTDKCNASCPQCGMRISNKFPRKTLGSEKLKLIIDHAARQQISAISFTGGEPFLERDLLFDMIRYTERAGIPYIRTGTNGFMFMGSEKPGFEDRIKRLAEELCSTSLYTLWISLDSAVPEIHEEMRNLPGVICGIEKALPIFHRFGIYPAANLGINRRTGGDDPWMFEVARGEASWDGLAFRQKFEESFSRFYRFVIGLGFTMTNACYPMSVEETDLNAVYTATSSDLVIRFSDREKIQMFKALYETIPRFRSGIRIFSPRSTLVTLIREYENRGERTFPCRGGIDFFYIDAEKGHAYPCGYRGNDDLGPFEGLDILAIENKPWCKKCDWECFRDPSVLLGPLNNPGKVPDLFRNDPQFLRVWWEDLRYYKACRFFNGRIPPDRFALESFRKRGGKK